jgi:hypothetical protein
MATEMRGNYIDVTNYRDVGIAIANSLYDRLECITTLQLASNLEEIVWSLFYDSVNSSVYWGIESELLSFEIVR